MLKRYYLRVLLGVSFLFSACWVNAEFYTFHFSGKWESKEKWKNFSKPFGTPNIRVAVVNDAISTISSAVSVERIMLGHQGSPGHLILDGADAVLSIKLMGVGRVHNKGAQIATGSLVVKNGAQLTVEDYLAIGYEGAPGTFDLYEGTVSTDRLVHSPSLSDGIDGITTLHGGVLTVKRLVLDGGQINIAGGTFRVGEDFAGLIKKSIANGRLLFNGSSDAVEDLDYTIETVEGYISIQIVEGAEPRLG